jgi:polyketide biosynthesis acyl carrier protein
MSKEQIFEIIVEHLVEVLPEIDPQNVLISNSFSELGANSIDRMEIVTMTLQTLNLKIPLMAFAGARNIEELVDIFHAK